MASRRSHVVLILCWLLATFPVLLVQAQSVMAEKSGSQSTTTVATILQYRSVFEHYQSYDEIDGGSWREANDTVGRVGSEHFRAENVQPISDTEEIELRNMSMQADPPLSLPVQKSSHKHNHGPKP